jgi:hydrogenase maturation factor
MMTGSAGIEGTAIIAREHAKMSRRVLGRTAHARACVFHRKPGISVVPAALVAADLGASALHDPTEGGVAAGLHEMATASGRRLVVDLDDVAVHPYTAQLCDHLGLNAMGLISSGALLATVPARRATRVMKAWTELGIPARAIGRVARGRGVEARRGGRVVRFTWSQRDEMTRLPTG